jgi:hypothetical protein
VQSDGQKIAARAALLLAAISVAKQTGAARWFAFPLGGRQQHALDRMIATLLQLARRSQAAASAAGE